MAGIQQLEPLQQEPSPSPVRRPKFPKELLDREEGSRFIDPAKELAIIVPQQTVASAQIALEAETLVPKFEAQRKQSAIVAMVELLSSWLEWVKRRLRGSRRRKARLTRHGERALEQLRYLSALCDATSCRTPDEVIAAESAFGEAYHEIMSLSSNLERMREKETNHHLHRYGRHISKLLQSD